MMRAEVGTRCSAAARARKDVPAGTAPSARRWLLIEHWGLWARKPLESEPFTGTAGAQIRDYAAEQGARVLLIRRPGPPPEEDHVRQWFVVDTTTGLATTGTWEAEGELVACAKGIGAVAGAAADDAPPFVLVCTHGVRDACCAIWGRPIAGTLRREFGEDVWECSHLGGHRFAATLLLLPDGACYGYLDQGNAARVVREHRAGRVSLDHFRGYTKDPRPSQAALVWAMRQDPEHASQLMTGGCVVVDERTTRVEVGSIRPDSPSHWLEVTRVDLEPGQVGCGRGPEPRAGFEVAPVHM